MYAQVLGIVDSTSIVVSRSGANLNANPLGSPVQSVIQDPTYSLFFNDSWKIKPNLTLSYGLNWTVQMPPYDVNGDAGYHDHSLGPADHRGQLSGQHRAACQPRTGL